MKDRTYTVKVEDETGRIVHLIEVNLDRPRGSNSVDADLTDVEHALWMASPNVCFFDCYICR